MRVSNYQAHKSLEGQRQPHNDQNANKMPMAGQWHTDNIPTHKANQPQAQVSRGQDAVQYKMKYINRWEYYETT